MPQYELNLRDYLRIFHRRKFVIAATLFVVIIITMVYLSMQSLMYEASATVKILEQKTIAGLLTEWVVYTPADLMESQTKIIKGFPIMKKVALQMGFIADDMPEVKIHRIVAGLQGQINTETVSRTNIISITATSATAMEAMTLANAVAQIYVAENLLEKTKQARTARYFIEEQLAQLEGRLTDREESLRRFGDEVKDIRMAEPIQKKLINLEFELATLLQKYTEKYPLVIQLKDEIKNLETQLAGLSNKELEYARLIREVEVSKKLYSMLKEKLEEARITEAQKVGDVSMVNPAMPGSAIGANKRLGLFVGAIIGIIAGIALAFIFETLDTSIGTIEDVEQLVNLPVLGTIPSITSKEKEAKNFLSKFKIQFLPVKKDASEETYGRLIVHYKPLSPISEAYRNIRTNLKIGPSQKTFLITSAGPAEGKTTVLTNLGLTIAQKGLKTLLVSSDLRRPVLARTFGINREPGLNEIVTGTASIDEALKNISDIMLGDMKLDDIMQGPGIENIYILPSGHLPHNPTEILESTELANVIEELKKRFDVILFDSPPILPVTDASLLVSKVDRVILCYEVGRTARGALLRAKSQLESVGAKILGVVLNQINPQTEVMTPYSYYKYRYYGKKDESGEKVETEKGQEKAL
ncbi:MAG: polysaccharide biosynthesis tyrosine autokinase [bacterium]